MIDFKMAASVVRSWLRALRDESYRNRLSAEKALSSARKTHDVSVAESLHFYTQVFDVLQQRETAPETWNEAYSDVVGIVADCSRRVKTTQDVDSVRHELVTALELLNIRQDESDKTTSK